MPAGAPAPSAADCLEADVVRFFDYAATAIEGDIELARQAIERAIVEDVMMPLPRVGPGVDQLVAVDAGDRTAGDVADIGRRRRGRRGPAPAGLPARRCRWLPRSRGSAGWRGW